MPQDIKIEDLIVTESDGSSRINHELLESFGLFNLPKPILRRTLMVYYENARRQDDDAASEVRTFINLASSMARFPVPVSINFTRGAAYRRNLKLLGRFSR